MSRHVNAADHSSDIEAGCGQQGQKGPDLTSKNFKEWVDITTEKQAKAHFDKYSKDYGKGHVVTHDTNKIIKENDIILKAKNDWETAHKDWEAAKAKNDKKGMAAAAAKEKTATDMAESARRRGGTIKREDSIKDVQQKNDDIIKAKQDWETAHKDWEAARAKNDKKGMAAAEAREKAAHERAEKDRREGGTVKEKVSVKEITDKNKEIKEAKEAWEKAKEKNDEKGMKEAHEKAEKARHEGGTIKEKDSLKDVEKKNDNIREAKREWEKAKEKGDEKAMKEAHEKAEKARREGGTIK